MRGHLLVGVLFLHQQRHPLEQVAEAGGLSESRHSAQSERVAAPRQNAPALVLLRSEVNHRDLLQHIIRAKIANIHHRIIIFKTCLNYYYYYYYYYYRINNEIISVT